MSLATRGFISTSYGVSHATRGFISTPGGAAPGPGPDPGPVPVAVPSLPDALPFLTSVPRGTITIVVPTAINTVLLVSENIVDNLRARQKSNVSLPSMYKRAYLIAYETDEIALLRSP